MRATAGAEHATEQRRGPAGRRGPRRSTGGAVMQLRLVTEDVQDAHQEPRRIGSRRAVKEIEVTERSHDEVKDLVDRMAILEDLVDDFPDEAGGGRPPKVAGDMTGIAATFDLGDDVQVA